MLCLLSHPKYHHPEAVESSFMRCGDVVEGLFFLGELFLDANTGKGCGSIVGTTPARRSTIPNHGLSLEIHAE